MLMGMANALTCRLFMVSLQHLDVSLCHTIGHAIHALLQALGCSKANASLLVACAPCR